MVKPQGASQAMPTTTAPTVSMEVAEEAELKQMFVTRVLCGRTTTGDSSMRRPPRDLSDPTRRLFDSTCDYSDDPSIFVVYNSAQAYPEYLVTFRMESRLF